MKKILYTLSFLALGTAVVAQPSARQAAPQVAKKQDGSLSVPAKPSEVFRPAGEMTDRGVALWSSDFSDASQWTFVDQSTPFPLGWQIITNVNASPVGGLNPLAFPGAANGFAMVNADSASAGASSFQNASIRTANPIDLTDVPFVALTFLQVSRNFATEYFFEYSFDGETWMEIAVNTDLAVNTNTPNPGTFYQTVGNLIGGQPQVWIGFRYQADWGWFWAIDDVALVVPADNDITLSDYYWNDWLVPLNTVEVVADYDNFDDYAMVRGYEYSSFITGQERPLNFIGFITNNGNLTQTGVVMTVTLTAPGGGTQQWSSTPISVEPGESADIFINNITPSIFTGGAPVGTYTVAATVTSAEGDDRPEDNSLEGKSFRFDTEVMSNDATNNQGTTAYVETADAIWGTRLAFTEPTEITHVRFVLWTRDDFPTVPGEEIFINVRAASVLNAVGANNPATPIYGLTDLDYIIEESAISPSFADPIFINYELPGNPITVQTNRVYQGEIHVPPVAVGQPSVVRIMASGGNESFSGVVRDFTSAPSGLSQGWFGLGSNAPMIRLVSSNTENAANVPTLDFKMGQNFPNPTTGETTIDWELLKPGQNVRFAITDINGRTVYTKDLGDRPAGVQEPIRLNINNFAAGNYQYSLTIGNQRLVKKMVIVK